MYFNVTTYVNLTNTDPEESWIDAYDNIEARFVESTEAFSVSTQNTNVGG